MLRVITPRKAGIDYIKFNTNLTWLSSKPVSWWKISCPWLARQWQKCEESPWGRDGGRWWGWWTASCPPSPWAGSWGELFPSPPGGSFRTTTVLPSIKSWEHQRRPVRWWDRCRRQSRASSTENRPWRPGWWGWQWSHSGRDKLTEELQLDSR